MTTLTAQEIAGAAQQAGFTGQDLVIAVAVAFAESSGETTQVHPNDDGSTDYGLWQINTVHGSLLNQGDKFNPIDNARMAYTVWRDSGWGAWTTYNTGAYLPYMARAQLAAGNPVSPGTGTAGVAPTSLLGSLQNTTQFLTLLGNKQFWVNTFYIFAGGVCFTIGIVMMVSHSQFADTAKQLALKAAKAAVLK